MAPAKVVSVSSSKLFISHVRLGDSANYSCVSDIARPDSIQLVVTQGATTQYKHNCPRLDPWLGLFHLLRVTFQFPPRCQRYLSRVCFICLLRPSYN